MKLQAIILSLVICVYVGEQFKVPLMANNSKKSMCCHAKMKCHRKTANKTTYPCDNGACINCPLTYTFTFQPSLKSASIILPFKKSFTQTETNIVSGVSREVWRPPNIV